MREGGQNINSGVRFCVDRVGDESSHRKLRFNTQKGKCKCFRCGYGAGGLETFFRALNGGALRIDELILIKGEKRPPQQSVREEVLKILYADEETRDLKPYPLPPETVSLHDGRQHKLSRRRAIVYLEKRKVHERLVEIHDLRYCPSGAYAGRIIFPVYQGGEMVYWTNRYCGQHFLKSKNPPNKEGFHSKTTCILNYDNLVGAQTVYIVEGPFDMLAYKHAGAVMGKELSDTQVRLFCALADHGTEEFVISLDAEAIAEAEAMYDRLVGRVPKLTVLPLDYGDPDERKGELNELAKQRRTLTVADRVKHRLGRG